MKMYLPQLHAHALCLRYASSIFEQQRSFGTRSNAGAFVVEMLAGDAKFRRAVRRVSLDAASEALLVATAGVMADTAAAVANCCISSIRRRGDDAISLTFATCFLANVLASGSILRPALARARVMTTFGLADGRILIAIKH